MSNSLSGGNIYYDIYASPFCDIILVWTEKWLQKLHLDTWEWKKEIEIDESWKKDSQPFEQVKKQLDEYFSGERKSFDVKLDLEGTDYQKQVWGQLQKIPYWEVWSYKQVACELGKPKASRAVWMANAKNPIPLIIPCHRVIWANGKLTGFAHGLRIKEQLLSHEKWELSMEFS